MFAVLTDSVPYKERSSETGRIFSVPLYGVRFASGFMEDYEWSPFAPMLRSERYELYRGSAESEENLEAEASSLDNLLSKVVNPDDIKIRDPEKWCVRVVRETEEVRGIASVLG